VWSVQRDVDPFQQWTYCSELNQVYRFLH
jgi:hypothetical protein